MDKSAQIRESLQLIEASISSLQSICKEEVIDSYELNALLSVINRLENAASLLKSENGGDPASDRQEGSKSIINGLDTILIVDDDPSVTKSLAEELKEHYQILTASDGIKGLQIAMASYPDIIISDIGMPEMDGLEMCSRIKSSSDTSHIPVILLTGKQDKQTIIRGFECGASDYITKPYDIAVLQTRIRNILSERQHLRDTILSSSVTLPASISFTSRMDKEFMNRVLKVVEKEIANPDFQMDNFCRQLAMSRTAFYNKLKALTGMGPNDFVRKVRLDKAKVLLSSKLYNVTEVSEMVGFSDPKYFSICFKKQFDINPSKLL